MSAFPEYGSWALDNADCIARAELGMGVKTFGLCWVSRKPASFACRIPCAATLLCVCMCCCGHKFCRAVTAVVCTWQCIVCACQAFFFAIRYVPIHLPRPSICQAVPFSNNRARGSGESLTRGRRRYPNVSWEYILVPAAQALTYGLGYSGASSSHVQCTPTSVIH
eukprot:924241-Rhodomonas_salina.1